MPGFLLALLVLFVAVIVLNMDVGGLFSREYVDAPWSLGRFVDLLKHLWIPALDQRDHRHRRADPHHARQPAGYAGPALRRSGACARAEEQYRDLEACRAHRHQPADRHPGSEALPSIITGDALVSIVLNLPTIGPLFVDRCASWICTWPAPAWSFLRPAADRQPVRRPGPGLGSTRASGSSDPEERNMTDYNSSPKPRRRPQQKAGQPELLEPGVVEVQEEPNGHRGRDHLFCCIYGLAC